MNDEDSVRKCLAAIIEAQDLTQEDVGLRVGAPSPQVWTSRRMAPKNKERTKLTINDAAAIAKALNHDMEIVITPAGSEPLLQAIGNLKPQDVELALELIRALPSFGAENRRLLKLILGKAH